MHLYYTFVAEQWNQWNCVFGPLVLKLNNIFIHVSRARGSEQIRVFRQSSAHDIIIIIIIIIEMLSGVKCQRAKKTEAVSFSVYQYSDLWPFRVRRCTHTTMLYLTMKTGEEFACCHRALSTATRSKWVISASASSPSFTWQVTNVWYRFDTFTHTGWYRNWPFSFHFTGAVDAVAFQSSWASWSDCNHFHIFETCTCCLCGLQIAVVSRPHLCRFARCVSWS